MACTKGMPVVLRISFPKAILAFFLVIGLDEPHDATKDSNGSVYGRRFVSCYWWECVGLTCSAYASKGLPANDVSTYHILEFQPKFQIYPVDSLANYANVSVWFKSVLERDWDVEIACSKRGASLENESRKLGAHVVPFRFQLSLTTLL